MTVVLRWRYALLTMLSAAVAVAAYTPTSDWQFFTWGSDLLFGSHPRFTTNLGYFDSPDPGGLHLYAHYPIVQIGPAALLFAAGLRLSGGDGSYAAAAAIGALGLVAMLAIDRTFVLGPTGRVTLLVGGAACLGAWTGLVNFAHLDDALALCAFALSCRAIRRDNAWVAGALLGLAAAAKPWAIVLLPLSLAFTDGRSRARCAAAALGTTAVAWGPFVLADAATLHLGRLALETHAASAAAAMGLQWSAHPEALRLLQFLGGLLLAWLCVACDAWPAAAVTAFSFRLLIEPMTYPYYGAGVVLAALIADLGTRQGRWPLFTTLASLLWAVEQHLNDQAAGSVRAATYTSLVVLGLWTAVTARLTSTARTFPRPTASCG